MKELTAEHVAEHEVAEEWMFGETEETEEAERKEKDNVGDEGENDADVHDDLAKCRRRSRRRTFWHGGL